MANRLNIRKNLSLNVGKFPVNGIIDTDNLVRGSVGKSRNRMVWVYRVPESCKLHTQGNTCDIVDLV